MPKLSTQGRYSTLGTWVSFRLEGTEELLWRAPMDVVPRDGELVGHLEGGDEVATWYKVETIKYEFDRESDDLFGVPPQNYESDKSFFGVCVLVSVVP